MSVAAPKPLAATDTGRSPRALHLGSFGRRHRWFRAVTGANQTVVQDLADLACGGSCLSSSEFGDPAARRSERRCRCIRTTTDLIDWRHGGRSGDLTPPHNKGVWWEPTTGAGLSHKNEVQQSSVYMNAVPEFVCSLVVGYIMGKAGLLRCSTDSNRTRRHVLTFAAWCFHWCCLILPTMQREYGQFIPYQLHKYIPELSTPNSTHKHLHIHTLYKCHMRSAMLMFSCVDPCRVGSRRSPLYHPGISENCKSHIVGASKCGRINCLCARSRATPEPAHNWSTNGRSNPRRGPKRRELNVVTIRATTRVLPTRWM